MLAGSRCTRRGELWSYSPVGDALWFELVDGVLHVFGEADMLTSPVLFAAVSERASSGDVVVDLAGVTFIDSSGLYALTRLRETMPAMRMVNPSPRVLEMLELTGLVQLLVDEGAHPPAQTQRPPVSGSEGPP